MYINGQRGFVRRIGRVSIALVLLVATGAGAVFAAGQPEAENTALSVWHYEAENSAMGTAWAEAMRGAATTVMLPKATPDVFKHLVPLGERRM